MPLPAIAALLSGGSASAAASAGARAAATEAGAASAARTAATKSNAAASGNSLVRQKKIDNFNALFKDTTEHALQQSEATAQEKSSLAQQNATKAAEPNKFGRMLEGIGNFDKQLSKAADASQEFAKLTENAAQNKFIPMIRDILPENMGKLADSVTRVVTAFIERGRELQMYSGQLSASFAVSDARETLADIKEAQETGSGIAKMNNGATDIWLSIREILLPIKRLFVDQLGDVLSKAGDTMQVIADILAPLVDGMAQVIDLLMTIAKSLSPSYLMLSLVQKIANNTDKKDKIDDLDKLIEAAQRIPIDRNDEKFRRNQRQDVGPQPLNLGLFAGI